MFKTKKSRPDSDFATKEFTSGEIAEVTGVSLRQLQWWDEQKVVSPRQEGHKRIYLADEAIEIAVIAELRRKGFSLQKIRRVLRFLQRDMGRRLDDIVAAETDVHLITDGKAIYLEDDKDTIIEVLKNAKLPMFVVCVTDQARSLSAPPKPARKGPGREAAAARKSRAV